MLWCLNHRSTSFTITVTLALSSAFLSCSVLAQTGFSKPTREDIVQAARGTGGSPFIPIDSWIYLAVDRLHDLGYLPTFYVGMRPYTRVSLTHALRLSRADILTDRDLYGPSDEAVKLYDRLRLELTPEMDGGAESQTVLESTYARVRGLGGIPLNDSFHLGQTFTNDYGRPYQQGLNSIAGFSSYSTRGRFNLYVRGEYQHAPASVGYSSQVAEILKANDGLTPNISHPIIPEGPIAQTNQVRLLNASASVHVLGHQVSFGRSDEWLGPAAGGSFAWSTNAEPIYAFRVNRVEPLFVPILSRLTGPFRYEFFVGSLKGHDTPNDSWVHVEKASFKPHPDLEFGFCRTVIWGGKGHVPITLASFGRSFFSPAGVQADVKFSRSDPGARFSTFDFNYRVPWHNYLFTIYADSFVHDNVFPVSNPKRAAVRPGLLLTRLPHLPQVSLRTEGAYTDVNDPESVRGSFLFAETVVKNGITNRQFIFGDPIGREDKGGNAWLTWHLSPDQQLQLEYRQVKAAKDFVVLGTTQQNFALHAVLRPIKILEVRGSVQSESWRAPLVHAGTQRNVGVTVQFTWLTRQLQR